MVRRRESRLRLARETVRWLSRRDLGAVGGGTGDTDGANTQSSGLAARPTATCAPVCQRYPSGPSYCILCG
jgi:hypothetical protein